MTGQEYENTVQNLMSMGFERGKVIAALKAANNNPDLPAEYLFVVNKNQSFFFNILCFFDLLSQICACTHQNKQKQKNKTKTMSSK